MTTANERRIRAGYHLFLAAKADEPGDWAPDAPVAALMHEDIEWFDDSEPADSTRPRHFQGKGDGRGDEDSLDNPSSVLGRLRQLRRQMPCCQILSCLEDETQRVVHTVDHGLKVDDRGKRPQLCASSFEFDTAGKVVSVHYCSTEMRLDLPEGQGG